ncbi:DNA cytosine methyltransferase [Streptomyces otsuchiensis]|uniref:DNA cytosine methyltransferase n=1 Tax=Streptomyces otsuchiensis TaxID=2681388 RepID=UPI001030A6EB|nr:DNA (cytosine-5-)-methyltransferase [Streptomyces otsuchiensis]
MSAVDRGDRLEVVEICSGAGGQSLGLHRAGFTHRLAVELDYRAAETLRNNLRRVLKEDGEDPHDDLVRVGDVADRELWQPEEYRGIHLLAGGVPCPPFSIAGKQLGTGDERDLFAWAVQQCKIMKPRALLLENVRGLSANRFAGYRQAVLDDLDSSGYVAQWKLLHASDFGVAQLRPRFVLVALQREFEPYFVWPEKQSGAPSVGEVLSDLMGANGWEEEKVAAWVRGANQIAPTIVGGSKKHGGADLGPTRAKRAWAELGVDAMGVADEAPAAGWERGGAPGPKLTTAMVARLQGWHGPEFSDWKFEGRKTSVYRQIGNAFPPPVAKAIGEAIRDALLKKGEPRLSRHMVDKAHDPVYVVLRASTRPIGLEQIVAKVAKSGVVMEQSEVELRLSHLRRDFDVTEVERSSGGPAYRLGNFMAFTGQEDHTRHEAFSRHRSRIS